MGPWVSWGLSKFKYPICTWIRHSRSNNGRWLFPGNVRSKAFLWQSLCCRLQACSVCTDQTHVDHERCKPCGPNFSHVLLSGIPSFFLPARFLPPLLANMYVRTYVMSSPSVEGNKARFPLMPIGSNYLLVSVQTLTAVWWTFFTEQL